MAGATLVTHAGEQEPSAWRFPGPLSAMLTALWLHRRFVVQSRGSQVRRVDWVQSAALLVRRDAAEAVGYLDPAFFVYSDEVDFCKRLDDTGWEVLYVPSARAVGHDAPVDDPRRRIVELSRNRDRYMRKHHGPAAARAVRWLTAFTYGVRALAALVLPGHEAGLYARHARATLVPGPRRGAGRGRVRLQPRRPEAVVARRRRGAVPDRGLCVLLLPAKLEYAPVRERAEDLLGAPGAVAVEPAAIGYGATGRLPGVLRERITAGQARRMALPGHPRALVVFDAAQYPLARALLAEHPEAELWYGGAGGGDLHEAAAARAALRFGGDGEPGGAARERNRSLWERMEALGIESGRLGSERVPRPD